LAAPECYQTPVWNMHFPDTFHVWRTHTMVTCLPSSNMILGEFGFYPCQTMRLLGLEVQYLFGPAVYTGSIYASFHR
jgi:hypothetical protein